MTYMTNKLLQANEPPAVDILYAKSAFPVALTCEHASARVPRSLHHLGLDDDVLQTHIGWDIGAAGVARYVAEYFKAYTLIQQYSRLVVDCNREPQSAGFIVSTSDHVTVPGNLNLSATERAQRIDEIFTPYDAAVAKAAKRPATRMLVSIHSFNPSMDGLKRPWDVGFLFRDDEVSAHTMAEAMQARAPELNIGYNKPYKVEGYERFFVGHAEPSGLPHALIEIRNDHLGDEQGQQRWGEFVAHAIEARLQEI